MPRPPSYQAISEPIRSSGFLDTVRRYPSSEAMIERYTPLVGK